MYRSSFIKDMSNHHAAFRSDSLLTNEERRYTVVLLAAPPISAKELCSSVRVVIGFVFTSLTKVLLAPFAQFVRTASSRQRPGSSI